jgi:hypothetical protein
MRTLENKVYKKIFNLQTVKLVTDEHKEFVYGLIIGSGYELKDWGHFVYFNLDFNWSVDYPTEFQK